MQPDKKYEIGEVVYIRGVVVSGPNVEGHYCVHIYANGRTGMVQQLTTAVIRDEDHTISNPFRVTGAALLPSKPRKILSGIGVRVIDHTSKSASPKIKIRKGQSHAK